MSAPQPYYERDGITIYCGDCAQVLPFLGPVDLLLTDPPYGIGEAAGKNKSRGKMAKARDYGNDQWDNSPPPRWLLDMCIGMADRSIVWGGNYFGLGASSCWLVWDKKNGDSDFADCELAWTNMRKAVRRIEWRWAGMLQENMGAHKDARVHPTQKPLAVMNWAITQAGDGVGSVLDPFMGSGTTLVAARSQGKRAVGIEREEKYCRAAVERLAQGVMSFDIGTAPPDPARFS